MRIVSQCIVWYSLDTFYRSRKVWNTAVEIIALLHIWGQYLQFWKSWMTWQMQKQVIDADDIWHHNVQWSTNWHAQLQNIRNPHLLSLDYTPQMQWFMYLCCWSCWQATGIITIKIMRILNVYVYRGESHVTSRSLTWILGKWCLLKCWQQLSISHFFTDIGRWYVKEQAEVVKQDIRELIWMITDSDDCGADALAQLTFLCQQISLAFTSRNKGIWKNVENS